MLSQIEDAFFFNQVVSSYSNSNNTAKTTYSGRFELLNEHLSSLFNNRNEKIVIHDVAVSSGVTTVDLYKWLDRNNYTCQLFASDRFSTIEYCGDNIKYFYDANGQLIQIYFFNVFLGLKISNYFFLSKLLFQLIKKFKNRLQSRKKIFLFDKVFNELVLQKKIHFFEFDLFDERDVQISFDFIRVMNVLNVVYFSEEQIHYSLRKLANSLNEGGILLIGRTSLTGINNATFYRKNKTSLVAVNVINDGYELDYIVNKIL